MLNTLEKVFNYRTFKKGQKEVIEKILEGQSAAAVFPTGSGKSLCYQLPATLLPGLTLVVSPLLALIEDQLDFLNTKGIPSTRIDSTLSKSEEQTIYDDLKQGKYKILMISVERFKNERFRNLLSQLTVSLMVVDEAHCISEWGHNFRPDYLKLPVYRDEFNIKSVLLLTATATPEVQKNMAEKFHIPPENIVTTGFYRDNLNLKIIPVEENRDENLLHITSQVGDKATIIYVTLQKTAEHVASLLQEKGYNAQYYHAGLNTEERSQIQQEFMSGKLPIIVATIAFGMGIDKHDIRYIIHYNLPKSLENYSQEIGRAGRDQEPSECTVLANRKDLHVLENFIYGDTPEFQAVHHLLSEIPQGQKYWEVKMNNLSKLCDIKLLPLRTLLTYLELKKIIEARYSYFKDYRYIPHIDEQEIINKFSGERKEFVEKIFDNAEKARKWHYLNIESVCQETGSDRQRVLAALDYFAGNKYIDFEYKNLSEVYQLKQPTFNVHETASEIYDLFKQKETAEVNRIHQMLSIFEKNQCLNLSLAEYFGDYTKQTACGHCSVCLSGPVKIPGRHTKKSPQKNYQTLIKPLKEQLKTEPSTDVAAKFLCGLATPSLNQIKAKKIPGYAELEEFPFNTVKKWIIQETMKEKVNF